jgi:uncharacterized protein (UPF0335 family)
MQLSTKHFVDRLEANIVQLARAVAIEHQIKVDPDAKKITREIVQTKNNQLLSQQEREGLKQLWEDTVANLKMKNTDTLQYVRRVYEALKTAGYDRV